MAIVDHLVHPQAELGGFQRVDHIRDVWARQVFPFPEHSRERLHHHWILLAELEHRIHLEPFEVGHGYDLDLGSLYPRS